MSDVKGNDRKRVKDCRITDRNEGTCSEMGVKPQSNGEHFNASCGRCGEQFSFYSEAS